MRDLEAVETVLDGEECHRSRSFVSVELRTRFASAHASLRRILASYLGVEAAQVRWADGLVRRVVTPTESLLSNGRAATCTST